MASLLEINLVALLNLSSWCLVMVERLFLVVPRGCLQFVIVLFPDHTHYFGASGDSFEFGSGRIVIYSVIGVQNSTFLELK